MHRPTFHKLLLLSFSLLFTTLNYGQSGISINSGKLFFNAFPGKTQSQQLIITNTSSEPVILQTHFKDWKRDSMGVKNYAPAATLASSCTNWISVSPQSISIPADSKGTVDIQMAVPEGYTPNKGVKNTMLFFKQLKAPIAKQDNATSVNSSIQIAFQIGVHLYYSHPALVNKDLVINDLFVQEQEKALNIELENSGETLLEAFVQFELTNMETGEEIQLFDRSLSVNFMPSDVRRLKFNLPPTLPAGNYSVTSIIDIGSDKDLLLGVLEIKI